MSVITLNFEGYVQCRLATDPDPTDERRGVSGYTFAMPGEPDLDWTIYTQPDQEGIVTRPGVERKLGVRVTGGFSGSTTVGSGHPLFGARINLLDRPRFEERNYIVSTQQFGVVAPFRLWVEGNGVSLYREVDFYPGNDLSRDSLVQPAFSKGSAKAAKKAPVVVKPTIQEVLVNTPQEVLQPYTYQGYTGGDPNCVKLMGASGNPSVYRQQRLETLLILQEKALAESKKSKDPKRIGQLMVELAALDKRIRELRIDNTRDRRTFQLVASSNFNYALNGPAYVQTPKGGRWLNGGWTDGMWSYGKAAAPLAIWPCTFWFGSWDADSLTCYMAGTVNFFDLGVEI